ncbi:MAG: hypothetical protein ACOVQN_13795 [Exiguobacterium sp.]
MAEATHQFHRGDQRFSVGKLWAAVRDNNLKVIPILNLIHMLDVWIWMEGTPNQVLNGVVPDKERHRERIESANIDAPIIISELVLAHTDGFYDEIRELGGSYDVLDGMHRLCKQVQMGVTHITVIVASKAQIEASKL